MPFFMMLAVSFMTLSHDTCKENVVLKAAKVNWQKLLFIFCLTSSLVHHLVLEINRIWEVSWIDRCTQGLISKTKGRNFKDFVAQASCYTEWCFTSIGVLKASITLGKLWRIRERCAKHLPAVTVPFPISHFPSQCLPAQAVLSNHGGVGVGKM